MLSVIMALSIECHNAGVIMALIIEYSYAEWHYAECCYAECRHAECSYAECRK